MLLINNPPEPCITWNDVFRPVLWIGTVPSIDADPDPTFHFDAGPASVSGSLPQVIHKSKSQELFFPFIHSMPVIIFSFSSVSYTHRLIGFIIVNILDSILTFYGKKYGRPGC
jgi:hypothetical protein